MGPERFFRVNVVTPFLNSLKNTFHLPIQQKAIHGDPDFILFCNGMGIGLELKASKKKPRKLQAWKGEQITRVGCLYLVADPENWPEIVAKLKRLDAGEIE